MGAKIWRKRTFMKRMHRVVLAFTLLTGTSGCAFMRLNGCLKLAVCGELAAYDCADDLICADADGHTLRSEPVSTSHNPCRICAAGSP
jgi:hypothetical protein